MKAMSRTSVLMSFMTISGKGQMQIFKNDTIPCFDQGSRNRGHGKELSVLTEEAERPAPVIMHALAGESENS